MVASWKSAANLMIWLPGTHKVDDVVTIPSGVPVTSAPRMGPKRVAAIVLPGAYRLQIIFRGTDVKVRLSRCDNVRL